MTKNERIAALEKTVADLAAKLAQQDKMITALIGAQTPKAPEWRYPAVYPFDYDPNTTDASRIVKLGAMAAGTAGFSQ